MKKKIVYDNVLAIVLKFVLYEYESLIHLYGRKIL